MKIQLAHFVDLEKCCKMSIWLQNLVLIQPRTRVGKCDDEAEVRVSAAIGVVLLSLRKEIDTGASLGPYGRFAT